MLVQVVDYLRTGQIKNNPCLKCEYYCSSNGTCQSKKAATNGYGYINLIDMLYCKPYSFEVERNVR
jgi:hypothetical protein